jgi:hypothetical protein
MDIDDSQKQVNDQSFPPGKWFLGKCKYLFAEKMLRLALVFSKTSRCKRG